jgi:hypothetical protein
MGNSERVGLQLVRILNGIAEKAELRASVDDRFNA